MDDKNQNEVFSYHYSAEQQKELERIRQKYMPKEQGEEDKMSRLRRLDASVTQKGTVISLILGIVSALLLGVGMCCCMLWADAGVFALGIAVGLLGILGVAMAYPVYSHVTKKERQRLAPEILRLTEELMKQ